ncbi:hypothetical protein DsansV1_C10g0105441 [Dioscorea sansibarensis]
MSHAMAPCRVTFDDKMEVRKDDRRSRGSFYVMSLPIALLVTSSGTFRSSSQRGAVQAFREKGSIDPGEASVFECLPRASKPHIY